MTRVRLITTGGTISSRVTARGLLAGANGAEILSTVDPGAVDVEVDDFSTSGSYALRLADLLALARRARDALADGVDAVVITHGTDTMEESAFLLDLFHHDQRPVVFTGAQRSFDSPAPDGPANLAAALSVAVSRNARGLGVLLVFDGSAWQAQGVRKVDTLASGAFAAPGRGPCLRVTPHGVALVGRQPRRQGFGLDRVQRLPRVDVVSSYVGCDGVLLEAAVTAGAQGLVLQAFGAGNSSAEVATTVEYLTKGGLIVLVCSRVFAGPVVPLYAGGGGADLSRAGAIFAADLSPWQARLLLSVVLASEPADPSASVIRWLDQAEPGVGHTRVQGEVRDASRWSSNEQYSREG